MSDKMYIPSTAQTIVESIYNKGVILNVPGHKVPAGASIEAKNYYASEYGLTRRSGISAWNSNAISYPPWQTLATYWKNTGVQEFLGIDQKFVYRVEADSYTRLEWSYTKAVNITTAAASPIVTAAADAEWDDAINEVQAGDVLVWNTSYFGTIASVDSATQLTLTANAGNTYGPGGSWRIVRAFKVSKPNAVDYAVVPGPTPKIVFADFSRFLYYYDGSVFGDYNQYDRVTFPTEHLNADILPRCVAYFKNRVWVGGYIDSSGYDRRQGIAWTELADLDDFTNGGYVDLPYLKGALKKLVSMGDFLTAFFDDGIYIGRPTNIATMPVSFQRLETGGVGLLGPRAVTPYIDSLFFVGQDNVYMLSARGMEPIGTPVVKRTIREVASSSAWAICAAPDLKNDRVLFGFPKDSDEIEEIWSYNIKTKAWGWDAVTCQSVSAHLPSGQKTWEDWVSQDYDTGHVTTAVSTTLEGTGVDWVTAGIAANWTVLIDIDGDGNYEFESHVNSVTDLNTLVMHDAAPSIAALVHYRLVPPTATWEGSEMAAYPSWESIGSSSAVADVYVLRYDIIDIYGDNIATDKGTALTTEIITGDRDFNAPDDLKTFYRLAVKLEEPVLTPLAFTVSVSNDRGQNWKILPGSLTIDTNDDEGQINFRMRGSMCRFRLVGVNNGLPYTINEITMDVRGLGKEVAGREDQ